jgi:hypothetical protein
MGAARLRCTNNDALTHTHLRARAHSHTFTHTLTRVHTDAHTHAHTHSHIHTHMHTHTNTHTARFTGDINTVFIVMLRFFLGFWDSFAKQSWIPTCRIRLCLSVRPRRMRTTWLQTDGFSWSLYWGYYNLSVMFQFGYIVAGIVRGNVRTLRCQLLVLILGRLCWQYVWTDVEETVEHRAWSMVDCKRRYGDIHISV